MPFIEQAFIDAAIKAVKQQKSFEQFIDSHEMPESVVKAFESDVEKQREQFCIIRNLMK